LSVISIITSWGIIYHYNIGSQFIITAFGFTSLILFFASLSLKWNWMFYKIRWIGDISYSSYLIHFPLQMIFAMIADKLGFSREVFYTPLSIILFIVILITLSLASHKLFELPSQRYIRKHFIVKKSLI
jgi:peptidoglycan/LPS O-acetylase OafA/YrhL